MQRSKDLISFLDNPIRLLQICHCMCLLITFSVLHTLAESNPYFDYLVLELALSICHVNSQFTSILEVIRSQFEANSKNEELLVLIF